MKRFIIALLVVFALPLSVFAADGTKFGSVDIQKVLLMSEAGKEAKDQLGQKAAKYETEKNAKEAELKKLKGELESQGVLLNESARGSKERPGRPAGQERRVHQQDRGRDREGGAGIREKERLHRHLRAQRHDDLPRSRRGSDRRRSDRLQRDQEEITPVQRSTFDVRKPTPLRGGAWRHLPPRSS